MNNFTFGNDRYQYYETICGGSGAGPGFDGTSAVHTHMTNSRLTDPEVLEWRFPVRLEGFAIRAARAAPAAGGAATARVRRMRFLEPMTAAILSNRRRRAAVRHGGRRAGRPGATGSSAPTAASRRSIGSGSAEMAPGDVFVIETPGGGGYGAPATAAGPDPAGAHDTA